jgi:hypothetical protein
MTTQAEKTDPQSLRETLQFHEFPKIPRLNRDICVTEKIDGTNAAVGITDNGLVYAQSRNRILGTGKQDDNMGFARWVEQNANLLRQLGPGLHFGEWWGIGIGRGYDIFERRFSLFNVSRWERDASGKLLLEDLRAQGLPIYCVPVLYEGAWHYIDTTGKMIYFAPSQSIEQLKEFGSIAVPGYMNPEGIVVYHKAGNLLFKVTVDRDQEWKGKNVANAA